MSITISYEDPINEFKPGMFEGEASTLGLAPGEWPQIIHTTMGNRQPFVRTGSHSLDGELLYVSYRQSLGSLALRIHND